MASSAINRGISRLQLVRLSQGAAQHFSIHCRSSNVSSDEVRQHVFSLLRNKAGEDPVPIHRGEHFNVRSAGVFVATSLEVPGISSDALWGHLTRETVVFVADPEEEPGSYLLDIAESVTLSLIRFPCPACETASPSILTSSDISTPTTSDDAASFVAEPIPPFRSNRRVSDASSRATCGGDTSGFSLRQFLRRRKKNKASKVLQRLEREVQRPVLDGSPTKTGSLNLVDLSRVLYRHTCKFKLIPLVRGQYLTVPIDNELYTMLPSNGCSECSFESTGDARLPQQKLTLRNSLTFFISELKGSGPALLLSPVRTSVTAILEGSEFQRVHIAPISDTVPEAYNFDFFSQYLFPYVRASPNAVMSRGELFSFHGVQFKLLNCDPAYLSDVRIPEARKVFWKPCRAAYLAALDTTDSWAPVEIAYGSPLYNDYIAEQRNYLRSLLVREDGAVRQRIGLFTLIHRGEPVMPHWLDLLSSDALDEIYRMPARLRPFAVVEAIRSLDPASLLRALGLTQIEQTEDRARRLVQDNIIRHVMAEFAAEYQVEDGDEDCVVCLGRLKQAQEILELPCKHVFHFSCLEEWLKRSLACPICKRDISSFIDVSAFT